MLTWVARVVVISSALWLLGLAAAIIVAPSRAARFLGVFASSARAHYVEQVLRLIAGAGFVVFAPEMRFPQFFSAFGWVVVVTAAVLLLVPWRLHHRFGEWAIPLATRHIKLYGLGSFLLGVFVLYAAIHS